MSWFPQSKDHLPLTWWNRTPIYLAVVLALVGLVSMVVTAILLAIEPVWVRNIIFTYESFIFELKLWTPLSYVFFNPPSIWLVIGTYLLWRFGEEVERFLGRRAFVKLVVFLLLTPPLLITLIGLLGGGRGAIPWMAAGINDLELGVFLAFVALYPRAQLSVIIATIPAWVMALIIVGVRALQLLAARSLAGLVVLAGVVFVAYAFVQWERGHWSFAALSDWMGQRRRKGLPRRGSENQLNVLPPYREDREEPRARPSVKPTARTEAAKVDAILEKISTKGMQSLTAEERRVLEQASERLKKG